MTESTAQKLDPETEPKFELRVTDDSMRVLLTCDRSLLEGRDLYGRVLAGLQALKVKVIRDRMDLLARAELVLSEGDGGFVDEPVAEGTPAIPSEDARVEWSKDYFNTQYVVDPDTGQIDFTRRVGDPSVEDGELVAVFHDAKPGVPGSDVFGNVTQVAPPKTELPTAGDHVEFDEEAHGLRATRPGRISREENRIHVDNVYEILTDVGGETGSISHKGTVIVHGEIDDSYVLEATEDVEVRGTIHECRITCGGNLAAMGGITSNYKGTIRVEGTCQTRYAIQTNLDCNGQITVEKELYQTATHTFEGVTCPRGRIVGGKTIASKGIEVGEAGSKSGTPTHLVIEADPATRAKIAECRASIDSAQKKLNGLYDRFRQLKSQLDSFGAAGEAALAKTQEDIDAVEEQMLESTTAIQELLEKQKLDKTARILVRDKAYQGVIFRILGHELRIDTQIGGPFVARLDWQKMEVTLQSGTE
ncbi:MAG: DUF342 domain-containing protein [Candidatus Eisenbacteria bacterium]|uniref:DUF342 domain-containing protein n=1 Tax=Eiseniibacteriota bacterium TaxID=2212470 RepID=A0A956SBL7_UNCEI|nr:DUF342 domain-containing protein [Candidatus Eisenbacteria bacterium]